MKTWMMKKIDKQFLKRERERERERGGGGGERGSDEQEIKEEHNERKRINEVAKMTGKIIIRQLKKNNGKEKKRVKNYVN